MESEFRGTLYDANMYMRIRMCDICARPITIYRRMREQTDAPKWESSQNSDWKVEKMYGGNGEKNEGEKAKRAKHRRRSEERSGEFTHARRRRFYVAGKHKDIGRPYSEFLHYWFMYASNYKQSCLCGNISAHFY